jgi:hypothetical protein
MSHPAFRAVGPLAVVAALAALPAPCDELILVGGGRVSGRIVERSQDRIAIETGPGRVTLPMSRVARVVESRSALEVFEKRASELAPGDVDGWTALAVWATERELLTQARGAWQRVLAFDPGNPQANAGLGRVALDGRWMSPDDAYRAQGYVSYEGRWLTPAEHEAALRERDAREAWSLAQREADVRVREAEARVREAEARAREAETVADGDGGIPLGYVYGAVGYGYGYGTGYGRSGFGRGGVRPRPHREPLPAGGAPGRPAPRGFYPAPTPRPAPAPVSRPAASTSRRTASTSQAAILPPPPARRR